MWRGPEVFSMIELYSYNSTKAKGLAAVQHDAGRQHNCFRRCSKYEDMAKNRESSRCAVAEKTKSRRRKN